MREKSVCVCACVSHSTSCMFIQLIACTAQTHTNTCERAELPHTLLILMPAHPISSQFLGLIIKYETDLCVSWMWLRHSVNHTLLKYFLIAASAGTFCWSATAVIGLTRVRLRHRLRRFGHFQSIPKCACVCVNAHDRCRAHPGSDSTLQRCTEFPFCCKGERGSCWRAASQPRPIASPSAPLKRLHCSQQSEAREWAKESYEARRWGRGWGGGRWARA